MKLESISIRNFRGIGELDLSFRDELGMIRDCIPIVGPNTSGKTTILDAIGLCFLPFMGTKQLREGLPMRPHLLVRSGAVKASVSCTIWFSDDEVAATREVFNKSDEPSEIEAPEGNLVNLQWTFPDERGSSVWGFYQWEPAGSYKLFRGREVLQRNLHAPGLGSRHFRRLPGIVVFDQQRTGLSQRITSYERSLLGRLVDPMAGTNSALYSGTAMASGALPSSMGIRPTPDELETNDPRTILTSLAIRAQVPQDAEATEKADFAQLQQLFEHVCYPHKIAELINTDHGVEIQFRGQDGTYFYDGLSSGQQAILLMLLQMAIRRVHKSIVLIDELELHLHPLWQDRLYASLTRLGDDNQYFFTTHSTHLRDSLREGYVKTGDLWAPKPVTTG